MKRSKFIIGVALTAALVAAIAIPSAAQRGGMGRGATGGRQAWGGCGMGPQFTTEQQEQMQQIHEKYDAERVELSNRLQVIGVEMGELIAADGEPDFNAIEKKMENAAKVRLELAKLRLRIHKEVRPLLTDDQKVLFDGHMGRALMHGGRGGPGAMQSGGMGQGMGHGMRGRMGGGMQGRFPGGAGPGMGRQMMPGCMMGAVPMGDQPALEEIE